MLRFLSMVIEKPTTWKRDSRNLSRRCAVRNLLRRSTVWGFLKNWFWEFWDREGVLAGSGRDAEIGEL